MWRVRGVLRDYDWGPVDGLTPWHPPTGGPQAELWFGVHPSAPAPVLDEDRQQVGTLADVLPEQATPLLVKILAAARPLSIQVHPDSARARTLHARGLLPDDAAKVEALTALDPFAVHAGWRDGRQAAAVWDRAGVPKPLVAILPDREAAIRAVFALGPDLVAPIVAGLADAAESVGVDAPAVESLAAIAREYPDDPGVLVCVLMDHAVLEPGESVGVLPGVVHSYVRGLGVEVMTSSDNVLRLGLTSKPVALDEALGALSPDAPQRPPGPAFPFACEVVEGPVSRELSAGYRLALCLEGALDVTSDDRTLAATAGEAVVIAEQEPPASIRVQGRAALVRSVAGDSSP